MHTLCSFFRHTYRLRIETGEDQHLPVGAQPGSSEEAVSTALDGDWEFRGIRAPRGPGAKHYQSWVEE